MNLPTDIFCRAAVFPTCTKEGVFNRAALFAFSDAGNYCRALSLAGWDKCCNAEQVHDFGDNVATEKNRRFQEKHNRPPVEDEVAHYLGYYSIMVRNVSLGSNMYSKSVIRHAPEDGDDRHFHIELHPNEAALADKKPDRRVKSDERLLRDELATVLFGPSPLPARHCSERVLELQRIALEQIENTHAVNVLNNS
ncbi:hypothetical protein LZ686_00605 [Paracoccus sp. NFXS7]|uniref:hypothetical protein n=1 Tax=Paracoccus sp. NFXS7 TaxID=2908653 RepID=UPI0032DE9228